ncbi:hypothetical protein LLO_p0037 (plasmid) [Legionella longbeachae NSW150]|uniref:CRIB domain-containing protein n=1 Tax=Legionella longbeachae serogroup 1 (strain NSW150) TaxID=661367 RepID=D3HTU6_LEGLN|nr:hypothetical protein LLO_p0037 [Legionella longbeachae NSW150]
MNGYQDKTGNYNIGANKTILLGLLASGPVYTTTGQIEIREIPTISAPFVSTNHMIHLGYYVKAREILNLCNHIKQKLNLETG